MEKITKTDDERFKNCCEIVIVNAHVLVLQILCIEHRGKDFPVETEFRVNKKAIREYIHTNPIYQKEIQDSLNDIHSGKSTYNKIFWFIDKYGKDENTLLQIKSKLDYEFQENITAKYVSIVNRKKKK